MKWVEVTIVVTWAHRWACWQVDVLHDDFWYRSRMDDPSETSDRLREAKAQFDRAAAERSEA